MYYVYLRSVFKSFSLLKYLTLVDCTTGNWRDRKQKKKVMALPSKSLISIRKRALVHTVWCDNINVDRPIAIDNSWRWPYLNMKPAISRAHVPVLCVTHGTLYSMNSCKITKRGVTIKNLKHKVGLGCKQILQETLHCESPWFLSGNTTMWYRNYIPLNCLQVRCPGNHFNTQSVFPGAGIYIRDNSCKTLLSL